jgi:hypothetical protein
MNGIPGQRCCLGLNNRLHEEGEKDINRETESLRRARVYVCVHVIQT